MEREYSLKLSIIVPVYNVEQYLERCVESLLNQDIDKSDYEIILINDGSTDGSYEIAQRLAKENRNIVLLTQKNKGLSGARNTGLKHVRGKYLMFVDSDDFLTFGILGKIIQIAEANTLEMCFFRTIFERSGGVQTYGEEQCFDNYKVYDGTYLVTNGMKISSVWQNLYLSSFLFKAGIKFSEGIIHEDIDFNYTLYPLSKRIMFTDLYVYHYCLYRESILRTRQPEKIKYLIESDFQVVANIKERTKGKCYSKEIKDLYGRLTNSIVVSNMIRLLHENAFSRQQKYECLYTAKRLGIYPIHGYTNSWRTTLLGHLLNYEWLYKCLLKYKSPEK